MSAETYAALEAAIRAHVADESDEHGITTDWYLIAAAESMVSDSRTDYMHIASQSPLHTLHGLVDLGHRRLQTQPDID